MQEWLAGWIANARALAGRYDVEWRGDNDLGHAVGSGVYIYRFEAGDYQRTLKMILMK